MEEAGGMATEDAEGLWHRTDRPFTGMEGHKMCDYNKVGIQGKLRKANSVLSWVRPDSYLP